MAISISPTRVANDTGVDIKSVVTVFHHLDKLGIMKSKLNVICPKCGDGIAEASVFSEIPYQVSCDTCGYNGFGIENAYIYYEVR